MIEKQKKAESCEEIEKIERGEKKMEKSERCCEVKETSFSLQIEYLTNNLPLANTSFLCAGFLVKESPLELLSLWSKKLLPKAKCANNVNHGKYTLEEYNLSKRHVKWVVFLKTFSSIVHLKRENMEAYLFLQNSDSRSNRFQGRGNDSILKTINHAKGDERFLKAERSREYQKSPEVEKSGDVEGAQDESHDPLKGIEGPMTRARWKRMQEELSSLITLSQAQEVDRRPKFVRFLKVLDQGPLLHH